MPRFEPFRGLRYDAAAADLAAVTAPPYDVIDPDERAQLVRRDPHNIVRIDLPADEDGENRYVVAPRLLDQWTADGVLLRDPTPLFYGYAMSFTDDIGARHQTVGVVGALELHPPGSGGILPHEQTTPKAKSDRLKMLQVTRTNLSSIWGLSPAPGLTTALEGTMKDLTTWSDRDGVTHTYWLIDEPGAQEAISSMIGAEAFVIADGHHRYETSLAYKNQQPDPGAASSTMAWVVELVADQIDVKPIHRLLTGVRQVHEAVTALERFFHISSLSSTDDLTPAVATDMGARASMVLVLPERAYWLTPKPEAFDGVRDLDTSRIDTVVSAMADDVQLEYQHDIDAVISRVRKGDAQLGILVRPASADQILDIANGGERMPPKTTFFYPKPQTGVVLRPLD